MNMAGLRYVRGVQPNRAADFRGAAILDAKIPYKLTFILTLIAMLTKEPEMLQPDAFCEHTTQQNATAADWLRPALVMNQVGRTSDNH